MAQNNIDDLLNHWVAWSLDNGAWVRQTEKVGNKTVHFWVLGEHTRRKYCLSIEKMYSSDPARYKLDKDKRVRFKYDQRIAQRLEDIIVKLPDEEKMVVVAAYIYFPHLSDKQVARLLKMSEEKYISDLDTGIHHIGREYDQ